MLLKRPPRLRDGRGSILVEVLLSVVILSVSLTLIIRAMASSLMVLQYGSGYTMGLVVLENQMCELLRRGFIAAGLREEQDSAGTDPAYHYSLTTAPWHESGEDASPVSEVDMTISWRSGKRENQIAVQTLLSSRTP